MRSRECNYAKINWNYKTFKSLDGIVYPSWSIPKCKCIQTLNCLLKNLLWNPGHLYRLQKETSTVWKVPCYLLHPQKRLGNFGKSPEVMWNWTMYSAICLPWKDEEFRQFCLKLKLTPGRLDVTNRMPGSQWHSPGQLDLFVYRKLPSCYLSSSITQAKPKDFGFFWMRLKLYSPAHRSSVLKAEFHHEANFICLDLKPF